MPILSINTYYSQGIKWIQNHLIPCPFKRLTGIDCPFCGLQRSIIALLNGNFTQSFKLYPALLLLVIAVFYSAAGTRLNVNNRIVGKAIYTATFAVIIISYINKLMI
ncbi:DUF2752 domain-containing protein [Mucilaginibacter sp. KACC 22063]|uniref:DUF2752 domain-containing protein n=1 Tax=Mucilaginibacter sp. KACC 22063 TaxID=3025666 RepID=UPI003FD3C804